MPLDAGETIGECIRRLQFLGLCGINVLSLNSCVSHILLKMVIFMCFMKKSCAYFQKMDK